MYSGPMDDLKQKDLISVSSQQPLDGKGLSLDKSFTFGVLAAVASGLMVIFLTYTGYAASTFPSPLLFFPSPSFSPTPISHLCR